MRAEDLNDFRSCHHEDFHEEIKIEVQPSLLNHVEEAEAIVP
ncbi:hypothetical protein ACP4OV_001880 [Aristida adscensionis]